MKKFLAVTVALFVLPSLLFAEQEGKRWGVRIN